MAKFTSGWFKQSLRHSNARRFGRAGGVYSNAYLMAPRGSRNGDIIASNKYYNDEEKKYPQYINTINSTQAQNLLNKLNDKYDKNVKIRYLNKDEPEIFTLENTIYTTPVSAITPLNIAHEYAHVISSKDSTHDKEFENNLHKVINELPRKYGKIESVDANNEEELNKNKEYLKNKLDSAIYFWGSDEEVNQLAKMLENKTHKIKSLTEDFDENDENKEEKYDDKINNLLKKGWKQFAREDNFESHETILIKKNR